MFFFLIYSLPWQLYFLLQINKFRIEHAQNMKYEKRNFQDIIFIL